METRFDGESLEGSALGRTVLRTLVVDYRLKPNFPQFTIAEHPSRTDRVEIDLSKVSLYSALSENESCISGEEYLQRLRGENDLVPLDARVLEEILKNQDLIHDNWRRVRGIFFFGTVLHDEGGRGHIVFLYWRELWRWSSYWLDGGWDEMWPAAVIRASDLQSLGLEG